MDWQARGLGQLEAAIEYFRKCLDRRPRHPDGLKGLRDIAFDEGAYHDALEFGEDYLGLCERKPGSVSRGVGPCRGRTRPARGS